MRNTVSSGQWPVASDERFGRDVAGYVFRTARRCKQRLYIAIFLAAGMTVGANTKAQAQSAQTAPDPRAIVQKSLESFNRDLDVRRNYTYQRRVNEKQYDGSGNLKRN